MSGSTELDEVSLRIEATPEQVWDLISDITRMPEWSPALVRCRWRGRVREPVVGARFIGVNKPGIPTPNRIERAERGREFAFRTTLHNTVWRYLLVPDGGGTTVTEQRDTSGTRHGMLWPLYQVVGGRERLAQNFRDGMERTLQRLKEIAESPDRDTR
ncbi:SRPBCC family protein [Saccharopolyspora sp. MS10]|uniref:SRPBCC family protein n=1 Tax=Saccharopolyspora sp. MS10 TaxID=3385973 RepID=UPI00399EEBE1